MSITGRQKAIFYFYDTNNITGISSSGDIKFDDGHELKINPLDISTYYYEDWGFNDTLSQNKRKKKLAKSRITQGNNQVNTYTSMSIIFDLVDKYDSMFSRMNATRKGRKEKALSKAGAKETWRGLKQSDVGEGTSISVLNDSMCPYVLLKNAADGGEYIRFEWGAISITGLIESLDTNFSYFSSKGVPLRAEVNLTIMHCDPSIYFDSIKDLGTADKITEKIEEEKKLQAQIELEELEADMDDTATAMWHMLHPF